MKSIKTEHDWLDKAFPEGLLIPSSTVITGPLGAGKPIIALGFVSSWLKQGGSLIAAPLQFPDPQFASENLSALYGIKVQDYKEQFVHVQFDYNIDSVEVIKQNQMKANLVKPANWDTVVNKAKGLVRESKLGLMFFATALNLPLFSATYSNSLMDKLEQMFNANELTYLFCISTSMLEKKAEQVGNMADNLMESYVSGDPKRLQFKVSRAKNVESFRGVLEAPFSQEVLEEAEKRAQKFRVAPVKRIKKI